jgi:hypothetical protein
LGAEHETLRATEAGWAATKLTAICGVLLGIVLVESAWSDVAAGRRAYEKGDYATALKEFRPLADQGKADAQYNLGGMYALIAGRNCHGAF